MIFRKVHCRRERERGGHLSSPKKKGGVARSILQTSSPIVFRAKKEKVATIFLIPISLRDGEKRKGKGEGEREETEFLTSEEIKRDALLFFLASWVRRKRGREERKKKKGKGSVKYLSLLMYDAPKRGGGKKKSSVTFTWIQKS